MKRLTTALIAVLLLAPFAFSGGIVTNTNQSAAWARYFSRYSTTEIDAVYFNPAGLTKMNDGFHFSLNNQSIFQTWTISNDLSILNSSEFIGDVKAPFFPSLYGSYKTGKLAISFGVNPIGGGGSAEFKSGIPSVELGIASMPAAMAALGATGAYSYSSSLEGKSVYFGFQLGLSYEISDMLSVYVGGRYVTANNTYVGSITDVSLATASTPLTNASVTANANLFQGGGDAMQPIIDGGGATLTFTQLEALSIITPAERAQMEGGLLALGIPQAQIDVMELQQSQGAYYGAATTMYTAADALADQKLDTEQSGSGFTPIIGVNLSFMEDRLNIGLKYELKTKLELTNKTTFDIVTDAAGNTMFPDGAVVNADMPALLTGGLTFRLTDAFELSGGFEYYFDQDVNWDGREDDLESNMYNITFSAQYNVSEKFLLSGSYGYAKTGATDDYQSDLSFSLSSSSIGFGGAYNINENIQVNLGYVMVFYQDHEVPATDYTTIYAKETKIFAAGVNFSF